MKLQPLCFIKISVDINEELDWRLCQLLFTTVLSSIVNDGEWSYGDFSLMVTVQYQLCKNRECGLITQKWVEWRAYHSEPREGSGRFCNIAWYNWKCLSKSQTFTKKRTRRPSITVLAGAGNSLHTDCTDIMGLIKNDLWVRGTDWTLSLKSWFLDSKSSSDLLYIYPVNSLWIS